MNVIVIGIGYVGLVTAVCLAEKNHNVVCVDINKAKLKLLREGNVTIHEEFLEELLNKNNKNGRLNYSSNGNEEYKNADVIIIAVGTPENTDGSANLDYVYAAAKEVAENVQKDCTIIVKSTVPVGTNDKLECYIKENLKNDVNVEVVSNPEFLSQGTAIADCMNASRIIAGVTTEKAKKIIEELYKDFNSPILFMDRRSSEMVKYASNNFLAVKISYINEIANLCEKVGVNIDNVITGMGYDARIGKTFLRAGCGYGGSCLPKDTKALSYLSQQNDYDLKIINAAIEINAKQRTILVEKARKHFESFKDKNIAILGLAFKPSTDDLREAPALENIDILLKEGAKITVYDPCAMENLKAKYSNEVIYADTPQKALENAEICFIFTEWRKIRNITPLEYKELMKEPNVFDGRNIYDVNEMEKHNIKYYSIGRGM